VVPEARFDVKVEGKTYVLKYKLSNFITSVLEGKIRKIIFRVTKKGLNFGLPHGIPDNLFDMLLHYLLLSATLLFHKQNTENIKIYQK
jgi:hypothetical protein